MARRTFIDTANAARLLPKVEGLDLGAGDVPIFSTLAAAEVWEAANPGKKALTLEPSTPDATPPTWNATLTVGTPTDTQVVVTASTLATDDRAVAGYEVTYNGTTWTGITPTGTTFTLTGTAETTYSSTQLRAKDAAGNVSTALSVPSYTMAATPPADWSAHDAYLTGLSPLIFLPLTTDATNSGSGGHTFTVNGAVTFGQPIAGTTGAKFTDGATSLSAPLGSLVAAHGAATLSIIVTPDVDRAGQARLIGSQSFETNTYAGAPEGLTLVTGGTENLYPSRSTTKLTAGTTAHIVYRATSGGAADLFVNGIEVATQTLTGTPNVGPANFSIGGDNTTLAHTFSGVATRAAAWSRALTDQEIADLATKAGL